MHVYICGWKAASRGPHPTWGPDPSSARQICLASAVRAGPTLQMTTWLPVPSHATSTPQRRVTVPKALGHCPSDCESPLLWSKSPCGNPNPCGSECILIWKQGFYRFNQEGPGVSLMQDDSVLIRENTNSEEKAREGGAETGVIQLREEQHQGWSPATGSWTRQSDPPRGVSRNAACHTPRTEVSFWFRSKCLPTAAPLSLRFVLLFLNS